MPAGGKLVHASRIQDARWVQQALEALHEFNFGGAAALAEEDHASVDTSCLQQHLRISAS